jgi:hypothetical protein
MSTSLYVSFTVATADDDSADATRRTVIPVSKAPAARCSHDDVGGTKRLGFEAGQRAAAVSGQRAAVSGQRARTLLCALGCLSSHRAAQRARPHTDRASPSLCEQPGQHHRRHRSRFRLGDTVASNGSSPLAVQQPMVPPVAMASAQAQAVCSRPPHASRSPRPSQPPSPAQPQQQHGVLRPQRSAAQPPPPPLESLALRLAVVPLR